MASITRHCGYVIICNWNLSFLTLTIYLLNIFFLPNELVISFNLVMNNGTKSIFLGGDGINKIKVMFYIIHVNHVSDESLLKVLT